MQAIQRLVRRRAFRIACKQAPTSQTNRITFRLPEDEHLSVEGSALNVERSAPKGAVFLSYAREDIRLRQGYGGQADATSI